MTGHRGHATGHIDLARIEREDARLQALVPESDRAGRIARVDTRTGEFETIRVGRSPHGIFIQPRRAEQS